MKFNSDVQRRAYFAKKKCDFNFQCTDNALDGSAKEWAYRVPKNAPAKHYVHYSNKENPDTEHEADVCDGCLSTIDDSDDPNGSNTVHRIEYNRYAPDVESYDGKRSKKNEFTIYKAKTYEDWEKIQKSMAKYSAMTPKQRNDDYIKKIVPALRKSNMRDYGRYVIDKKGKYIGDKELAEKYGG